MISDNIKQDGRDAYFDGQDYDANPYDVYSDHALWSLWHEGWNDAYNDGVQQMLDIKIAWLMFVEWFKKVFDRCR